MATKQWTRSILIVEDDRAIAELVAWVLDDAGFKTRTASTIAQGLELYEQVRPDLVIIDLMLPDGSGADLLEEIHRRSGQPSVATLVMSALPRARERAVKAGADAYLPKPFDLEELLTTVEQLIDAAADGNPTSTPPVSEAEDVPPSDLSRVSHTPGAFMRRRVARYSRYYGNLHSALNPSA